MLNQNLTSLILVQYMFNLSLDVFEIPFIYADFSSFHRFYLFNSKFKNHMFSQVSPSAAGSFSDIIPLHRSALLPRKALLSLRLYVCIGTLQSNLL